MTTASQNHDTVKALRPYLLSVMTEQFGDKCAECGITARYYEIDHKRYGSDVTMYDLQLLCALCHRIKTSLSNEAALAQTLHCATCTCY